MIKKIEKLPINQIALNDKTPHPVHKSKLLGEGQQRIYEIGMSGTGKSRLLLNLIPNFTDTLNRIILASCVQVNQMHDAIEDWCLRHNIRYDKVTSPSQVENLIKESIADDELNEHKLLIFDDFNSMRGNCSTSNDPFTIITAKSINWLRNYNFSCIVIGQYYTLLPTRSRVSLTRRFVFKCESCHALDLINRDTDIVFKDAGLDFRTIYSKFVAPYQFNYLCISSTPPSIYAIDFTRDPNGRILTLYEIDSKKGSGVLEESRMTEDVAAGEIEAGNDSPYSKVLMVVSQMKRTKSKPRKEKLYDQILQLMEENDLDINIVEQIIKQ